MEPDNEMTDTPETDAVEYEFINHDDCAGETLRRCRDGHDVTWDDNYNGPSVPSTFARRLERERNEARRIVEKASEDSSESPCPVPTPLRVRERGSDAWVEDAKGRAVIERTQGLSEEEHEAFLAWVVSRANDH